MGGVAQVVGLGEPGQTIGGPVHPIGEPRGGPAR